MFKQKVLSRILVSGKPLLENCYSLTLRFSPVSYLTGKLQRVKPLLNGMWKIPNTITGSEIFYDETKKRREGEVLRWCYCTGEELKFQFNEMIDVKKVNESKCDLIRWKFREPCYRNCLAYYLD